jgi:putative redox protein
MSNIPLEVDVKLINQKVQFSGISKTNPDRPINFDYYPPMGDGQGFTGLELLLMSFAGCSGTAVVFLLRRMRKNVSGLKVNAKGIRQEQPPTAFEKIHLEFTVNSDDVTESDIQKAIKLSEESVCPVWAMLKNNVEVTTSYKIIA